MPLITLFAVNVIVVLLSSHQIGPSGANGPYGSYGLYSLYKNIFKYYIMKKPEGFKTFGKNRKH
jgi:hypothetical protein